MTYSGRAYLARLTSDGGLDSSFGNKGVVSDEQMEFPALLLAERLDGVAFYGPRSTHCVRDMSPSSLVKLRGDGAFDQSFGTEGRLWRTDPEIIALAAGAEGEITLIAQGTELGDPTKRVVRRLLPDGSGNPSFGRDGSVQPRTLRGVNASDLAVDHRGRVLIAGTALGVKVGVPSFVVARLDPSGHVERRFGHEGRRITTFGQRSNSEAEQLVLDNRGRALVGGIVATPRLATGLGFAFARYLPGR